MLPVTVVIHSTPQSPTHSTTILLLIEILHRNLILLCSPTHRTTKQIQTWHLCTLHLNLAHTMTKLVRYKFQTKCYSSSQNESLNPCNIVNVKNIGIGWQLQKEAKVMPMPIAIGTPIMMITKVSPCYSPVIYLQHLISALLSGVN
jgi:hypothetical protein